MPIGMITSLHQKLMGKPTTAAKTASANGPQPQPVPGSVANQATAGNRSILFVGQPIKTLQQTPAGRLAPFDQVKLPIQETSGKIQELVNAQVPFLYFPEKRIPDSGAVTRTMYGLGVNFNRLQG